MKSQVSIVKCNSYDRAEVEPAVRSSIELIGGIQKFIKPGSKVLVKPNLLTATEPQKGVTTHPEIVRAVVMILKELNAEILLGDGPSVWGGESENIEKVFKETGMKEIAEEFKVKLVNFNNPRWRGKFPLTKWLDEVDGFISLPKFKTHNLTILTGAIKNLFGLVPGTYKTELHKKYFDPRDFSKMLVEIYKEAPPTFSLVDAVVAMEGDGPGTSGKLRNVGLILASRDAVALDSVLSVIMGLVPSEILTTQEAARQNLGVMDLDAIEILGENLKSIRIKPFILPTTSIKTKIPQPVLNIIKNFIKVYPKLDKEACSFCRACIQACPKNAITIKFEAIKIDYAKCISCFCCQEVCPNAAIETKRSALAKLIGL